MLNYVYTAGACTQLATAGRLDCSQSQVSCIPRLTPWLKGMERFWKNYEGFPSDPFPLLKYLMNWSGPNI